MKRGFETKDYIVRIIKVAILLIIFLVVLNIFKIDKYENSKENASLVIFGDNYEDKDRKPFVDENGGIYIPFNTIYKTIDDSIFYDKISTKVIVTNESKVIKMKLDENKMYENFEEKEISTPVKSVDGVVYVDINLLKDIYGLIVNYNNDTKTISIDNESGKSTVKYNQSKVYSDITTKSSVITKLPKESVVMVYDKSLTHNRWYKIKTEDNVVGYIFKEAVNFVDNEKNESIEEAKETKKYNMFWQYDSNLKTLGDKIEGVNVCLPIWYEIDGQLGNISSKYNQSYYTKAKENGYEIWPVITNGIDSASYSPEDTSALLNSETSREVFIQNLLEECIEDKVDGINIDFESIKTEDRDVFTQLIREMTPIFRNKNIKVSVDTYFVEYLDRKNVGKACDFLVLMGYDHRGAWSQISGPIAEIPWVEEMIISLLNDSQIDSSKIILGIPFYTRLWIEKDGEDTPTTKVYTMDDCDKFVNYYGLKPTYDEQNGQNYVEYKKGSLTYKLWIEDETSIKNRVDLVNKYNLSGICGWRIGLEKQGTFKVISDNLKL